MATPKPTGQKRKPSHSGKRVKRSTASGAVVSRSATSGKVVAKGSGRNTNAKGSSAKVTNTAVRLSADDADRLDRLADEYADGDKSATIRIALQHLEAQAQRNDSMRQFLDEWDQELGGRDLEGEAEAKRRYFS